MSEVWRERVAVILEIVARDGLPNPRDLDVALDAIACEVAALVEAARREEREACARVIYASATRLEESAGRRRLNQVDAHAVPVLRGIADAIRARGDA
jgi:hypothetical protein